MTRIDLEITLLEDVVMSARSGSIGPHTGLDFIPGRALWGAAASRLYASGTLDPDSLFRAFQAGGVRFADAVPFVDGARCRPTPYTWQQRKFIPEGEATTVVDALSPHAPDGQTVGHEPTRWRTPATPSESVPLVWNNPYSLRTAIHDGRARKGYIFGYESLPAGVVLHTFVEGPESEVRAVVEALEGADVVVGRSRNAEYGSVRIRQIDAPSADVPTNAAVPGSVAFLCASRVALRDGTTGAVRLEPRASDFGLEESWVFDPGASIVRTERYSPFHGTRRKRDTERQVLTRGCVIVFRHPSGATADLAAMRAHCAAGVGIHRAEGLGEVLVEPCWLRAGPFVPMAPRRLPEAPPADPPRDALFRWAQDNAKDRATFVSVAERVDAALTRVAKLPVSAAQWGRVRHLARQHRRTHRDDPERFTAYLEAGLLQGAAGHRVWQRTVRGSETVFQRLVREIPPGDDPRIWVELLAGDVISRGLGGGR